MSSRIIHPNDVQMPDRMGNGHKSASLRRQEQLEQALQKASGDVMFFWSMLTAMVKRHAVDGSVMLSEADLGHSDPKELCVVQMNSDIREITLRMPSPEEEPTALAPEVTQ